MNKRAAGNAGEITAAVFLEKNGCKILERNFRRPTGEIDLIVRDRKCIVFVEVKQRSSLRYGRPAEAVNRAKQIHILRTAALYLAENGTDDTLVRFDVVEVLPDNVQWIRSAFDATDMADF